MFEKASLRTRLSFYLAIKQLGGATLTLRANELHLGKGGESLADTAKILSTYGNGFMLRTDSDKKIEEFSKHLTIPVKGWDERMSTVSAKRILQENDPSTSTNHSEDAVSAAVILESYIAYKNRGSR